VHRAHAEQAALQWNKNGPVPGSKDELPFMLANEIFNIVLFKEIREKGGKTYGINSRYDPYSGSSIYTVVTQVRNEEVLNTCRLFDATLKGFYEKGIQSADLEIAKKNMRNRWLMIESPDQVISFFNPIIYKKSSTRKNYLAEVDAVRLEDVNKVIKKYYAPDTYKLLISGDETQLQKSLSELNPLRRFTINDLQAN
jgi:predicted Zn-dependent peptidase